MLRVNNVNLFEGGGDILDGLNGSYSIAFTDAIAASRTVPIISAR